MFELQVTIDESMIKYMGRAVLFAQYTPAKPIKHGIKVFCVCCAYTAYLLGFEIYKGKDNEAEADGAAEAIVDRLITNANLTQARGRILYTDNWYTSISLAKHLYTKYGWTTVGPIYPTDKKHRTEDDILFVRIVQWSLVSG